MLQLQKERTGGGNGDTTRKKRGGKQHLCPKGGGWGSLCCLESVLAFLLGVGVKKEGNDSSTQKKMRKHSTTHKKGEERQPYPGSTTQKGRGGVQRHSKK